MLDDYCTVRMKFFLLGETLQSLLYRHKCVRENFQGKGFSSTSWIFVLLAWIFQQWYEKVQDYLLLSLLSFSTTIYTLELPLDMIFASAMKEILFLKKQSFLLVQNFPQKSFMWRFSVSHVNFGILIFSDFYNHAVFQCSHENKINWATGVRMYHFKENEKDASRCLWIFPRMKGKWLVYRLRNPVYLSLHDSLCSDNNCSVLKLLWERQTSTKIKKRQVSLKYSSEIRT